MNNKILTDKGATTSLLPNIAPGAIAVSPDTFVWKPASIDNSQHYCLFSYSTDALNPKPIPYSTGGTTIDMSTLLATNLNIGWRNVVAIVNNPPTWVSEKPLDIPTSQKDPVNCDIYVRTRGMVGASVGFQSSNNNGSDVPIVLPQTPVTVDGQINGVSTVLHPGFHSLISLNFWSNGHTFQNGSSIDLVIHFDAGGNAGNARMINEVASRNLINTEYVRSFQRHSDINPTLPILLGMVRHVYA